MIDYLDPDALEEMMTRYVLGDLSQDQAKEFEQVVTTNPGLAAEVARLRQALHLLPYAAAIAPPAHLRFRILRAAQIARTQSANRVGSRFYWSRIIGSVAAAVAIVLGWDNYRLRQELQLQSEVNTLLQQPNVVLSFSLGGTGTLSHSVGSVKLDLDMKKAAIVIRDLPPLPTHQVYRLWALLVGGETVPCGQFTVNAQGDVLTQLPIPVDAYTSPLKQLIVTVEPTSAPLRPTGPTVLMSS
jgi:anti-sigma-K factor RskA